MYEGMIIEKKGMVCVGVPVYALVWTGESDTGFAGTTPSTMSQASFKASRPMQESCGTQAGQAEGRAEPEETLYNLVGEDSPPVYQPVRVGEDGMNEIPNRPELVLRLGEEDVGHAADGELLYQEAVLCMPIREAGERRVPFLEHGLLALPVRNLETPCLAERTGVVPSQVIRLLQDRYLLNMPQVAHIEHEVLGEALSRFEVQAGGGYYLPAIQLGHRSADEGVRPEAEEDIRIVICRVCA